MTAWTITTVYMPLVRTPMIEPTAHYRSMPSISPEEASTMVAKALVNKPKKQTTTGGRIAEITYSAAPKVQDALINGAMKLFPGSGDEKRADRDERKVADRRKHWGWGAQSAQPTREALEGMRSLAQERLGFGGEEVEEPVPLDAVELPAPRVSPPASLAEICEDDTHARASHAMGKAYRDVVRGFRGEFENVPDVVARPRTEAEVEAVLAWCCDEGYAAIPYGGGTSVCGGVEPRLPGEYPGVVTIDLARSTGSSRSTRSLAPRCIQAGAPGPVLEDQLRERGLTMRCFPQSFEFSTLGGWIATRAGGHFATKLTHVDDMVESVRAITPAGVWESRRLPGSGAGPSPDRMLVGSEGILGLITQAWVRVLPRPRFKASCGVEFDTFAAGAEAVREISQSGLDPSNCRLLDPAEAAFTGAGDGAEGAARARLRVGPPPG